MRTRQLLQLPLFAPGGPVDTSRAAAAAVSPEPARKIRMRIYDLIRASGGLTADQCAAVLNLDSHSVGPRLWELEYKLHLVKKTDVKRETRSGCEAHVYVAID